MRRRVVSCLPCVPLNAQVGGVLAWLSLDGAGASRVGDAGGTGAGSDGGTVGIGGTVGNDAGGGSETKRSGVGTGGPKAPDAGGIGSGDAVVLKTGDAGWAVRADGDLAIRQPWRDEWAVRTITHHSIASLVYKMACQATY